ncbi:MAG: iron-containing alcohol dehydrogenase, partial [Actinobacteria bacterium]|nr:iron-containing alcohol dehydrogenase [Actinomycetota bacterium]
HPIVDALSAEAIRLIVASLPRAVADGADLEARVAMAYGSLLSGISMNNAEAMADQFFDEVIGPRFGIPHGIVAGLVLPHVVQYNRPDTPDRTALLADLIVEEPSGSSSERCDQAIERLHRLNSEIDLPALKDLGVPREDLPELARLTASHYGVEMGINPRELTEEGARAVLEAAWEERSPLDSSGS